LPAAKGREVDEGGASRQTDRVWESYGAADPYFGVLTHDRFRAGELTEQSRSEFFATGERHVSALLTTLRRFLDPAFAPQTALDFGCGVGRIAIPLARVCGQVTGVDVSPSMLREATANAERGGLKNLQFVRSDDDLSRVLGEFDLVHTYIVLQHLPADRGLAVIGALLDRVRPGGIAALHVLYLRRESKLRTAIYRVRRSAPLADTLLGRLRGKGKGGGHGLLEMNPTPLPALFEALQRRGFGQVHVEFTDHGNDHTDLPGAFVFARRAVEPRW
jgi:SAM-dependent methyltransferase